MRKTRFAIVWIVLTSMFAATAVSEDRSHGSILPRLPKGALQIVSTIPANGDVNPYGVAFVPARFASGGTIRAGDILVSNFNNSSNLQGTGTTIVSIAPDGTQTLFFQGPMGLGLTTALGILRRGVILVGNLPTTDGTSETVQQGSLIAIDRFGKQIASFTDPALLDGPWDLTLVDSGREALVFISNVLNGTVSRLRFEISQDGEHIELESATEIANGYLHRFDTAALVVGPTGLALDRERDTLFVASTGDNAIYAVNQASRRWKPADKGRRVYDDMTHLRGPLGLVLAKNGDLITTNGDAVNGNPDQPSEMVEFTESGRFIAQLSVDTAGPGGAFGIALQSEGDELRFAAVDDLVNTLKTWTLGD